MKTLTIDLKDRSYPIHIEGGLLARAGALLRESFPGGNAAVVSDMTVWVIHGKALTAALSAAGFTPFPILIRAGEASKSLGDLGKIYQALLEGNLRRNEPIIAFGGGVAGDIAGLAAATYQRGVPLVQIPTTLLAQVDSSVGGKVAVNLPGGKNMVGAFYQPKLVLADTDLLHTLPPREFSAGMAEVIKYAAIAEGPLLELLQRAHSRAEIMENITEIVHTCCDSKRRFVLEDEFDRGSRMMLNFGHTFGHAIEKLTGYERYNHGEAVAIGMVLAARMSALLGVAEEDTVPRLTEFLTRFGLPAETDLDPADLIREMGADKKNTGGEITLVLLKRMGSPVIHPVTAERLGAVWK